MLCNFAGWVILRNGINLLSKIMNITDEVKLEFHPFSGMNS